MCAADSRRSSRSSLLALAGTRNPQPRRRHHPNQTDSAADCALAHRSFQPSAMERRTPRCGSRPQMWKRRASGRCDPHFRHTGTWRVKMGSRFFSIRGGHPCESICFALSCRRACALSSRSFRSTSPAQEPGNVPETKAPAPNASRSCDEAPRQRLLAQARCSSC